MRNIFLDDKLAELNLMQVPLTVLTPDERTYTTAFLQPHGSVKATAGSIQNADSDLASAKHSQFLQTAFDLGVDLTITPEYSCPWEALLEAVKNGVVPQQGQIWVLGCESITPNQIIDITNADREITWVIADFELSRTKRFLDPACYLLWAHDPDGTPELVVAIQFKGQAMSDHDAYLERDYMIRGRERFIVRNDNDSIFLTTLICSDSLDFLHTDLPQPVHTPYLILHPQLNREPRYNAFKEYRRNAYLRSDIQEFICVNWATGFRLPRGGPSKFGGSAYYLKTSALPPHEDRLNEDHRNGLYYTIVPDNRSHIFFFNYDEGVFHFRTTKASQAGAPVRVLPERTGPEMIQSYSWNNVNESWAPLANADDGFSTVCKAVSPNLAPLSDNTLTTIEKEWLLALSAGSFAFSARVPWTSPSQLESFHVKDDEIVGRLTVSQDPDRAAYDRRFQALSDFARLRNDIITNPINFPSSLDEFAGNCSISYPIDNRYEFNLLKTDRSQKATVAFLGNCSPQKLQRSYDLLYDILNDPADQVRDEQRKRLVVWYDHQGTLMAKWDARSNVDKDLSQDAVSITKVIE